MTEATIQDSDIVWPDEEHLFAVDTSSSEDRAVSQDSDGEVNNVTKTTQAELADRAGDVAYSNGFWDHDDRNECTSRLRSVSPSEYPMSDEEPDKWQHDKFNLMKIGPPPGLGGRQKVLPVQQGWHHQSSRRQPPGPSRVLEVPRPPNTGQRPAEGWPDRSGYSFPIFSTADLNEDSKTPWPEESEVRGEDIDKWGWGEEQRPSANSDSTARKESSAPKLSETASQSQARPSSSNHDRVNLQHGARLSQHEEHNLQQVNQRNAELAALMTHVRLEELRQQPAHVGQHAAYQQSFRPPPAAGNLGYSIQGQQPRPPVQYHFSNGGLVPSYAIQMLAAPALPSSPASARPSLSHMFAHSTSQPGRPLPQPGLSMSQGQLLPMPAQAHPSSRPLDRTGAGYMPATKKGHRGYEPSKQDFHLKPGHLKASQSGKLLGGPPAPPAILFNHAAASFHPPTLPTRKDSRPQMIVNPSLALSAAAAPSSKPGKRALTIVDPSSKQPLHVAANVLMRTDSSSTGTSTDKPARKLISIVDPNNKQPIQLPNKLLGTNRMVRTNSNASAASSDTNQPAKRALAIVDPQNKQPVAVPASMPRQRQAAAEVNPGQILPAANSSSKRIKAPIAIVDPLTAAAVQLPSQELRSAKAGQAHAAEQPTGRMIRAKKPLVIVDPKAKANSFPTGSTTEQTQTAPPDAQTPKLAKISEAAERATLSISVLDDSSVRCQLQLSHNAVEQAPTALQATHGADIAQQPRERQDASV